MMNSRLITEQMNEFTKRFQLPDRAIHSDELPWIPFDECSWVKYLRFDFSTGLWINLHKIQKGAKVSRHRHTGGFVIGYTLQGSWRYLEKDWVARPGSLIFEPPGDIHTLAVDPNEDTIVLFMLDGGLQFFDENNNIYREDDIFTSYKRYRDYCEQHGLEIREDLIY